MMTNNNQPFFDKLFKFVLVLIFFKLISLFFFIPQTGWKGFFNSLIVLVIVGFVILMIINYLEDKFGTKNRDNQYGGGGGNNVMVESSLFEKLRNRYEKLATTYIEQKNYRKAAGIYLKLLQNPNKAAATLEDGKLYNEAALIYLKKCENKTKAAACFELGKDYLKAIKIHKELGDNEKVGDLYKGLNDKKNAKLFYDFVIDDYKAKDQLVKASLIYKYKLEDPISSNQLLLEGWNTNKDATNCINTYFSNIEDEQILGLEIQNIYNATADNKMRDQLIEPLKILYKKHETLKMPIRDIAYQILLPKLKLYPKIAYDLRDFNREDDLILKDISRFVTQNNKLIKNH